MGIYRVFSLANERNNLGIRRSLTSTFTGRMSESNNSKLDVANEPDIFHWDIYPLLQVDATNGCNPSFALWLVSLTFETKVFDDLEHGRTRHGMGSQSGMTMDATTEEGRRSQHFNFRAGPGQGQSASLLQVEPSAPKIFAHVSRCNLQVPFCDICCLCSRLDFFLSSTQCMLTITK